jgi:hypothetical protein
LEEKNNQEEEKEKNASFDAGYQSAVSNQGDFGL